MQRILSTLVRFRSFIVYLFFAAVALLLLNNRSFYHASQFDKTRLSLSAWLHLKSTAISDYFDLNRQNEILLMENLALKKLALKANAFPLYDQYYHAKEPFPFELQTARIIKTDLQKQRNFVLINKGRVDGVQSEMGVIGASGIVGIVDQVTTHFSSIISILHLDLKINAQIKNTEVFGSLSWKGTLPKAFQLQDIVTTNPVQLGDTIVTGGRSSYFPMGIPLGVITQVDRPQSEGYYQIDVTLFDNPLQYKYVYLLNNMDFDEIKSLENQPQE